MRWLPPVLTLSLDLSGSVLAQAPAPAAPRQAIRQVKPGLYMVIGDGGNALSASLRKV